VSLEDNEQLKPGYVIQLYIRVSVVLSQSLCRKEREKLDITLDSTVFVLARVKEI
jgi:hypothetical protein